MMNSGESEGSGGGLCPVVTSNPYVTNPATSQFTCQSAPIDFPSTIAFAANLELGTSWCPPYVNQQHYHEIDLAAHGVVYPQQMASMNYETLKYEYMKPYTAENIYDKQAQPTETVIKTEIVEDDNIFSEAPASVDDGQSTSTCLPSTRRGRPTNNPCWNYFIRIDDQLVSCRICSKVVKSACATNMTKHLERHHPVDFEDLSAQIIIFKRNSKTSPAGYNEDGSVIEHGRTYLDYTSPIDVQQNEMTLQDWQLSHLYPNGSQRIEWGSPAQSSISDCAQTSAESVIAAVPQPSSAPPNFKSWGGYGGTKPVMKRNRKTEHPVWEFFKRTADGNAQCTICAGVVKSPCSSNFMRHLMRHHSSEYNNVYVKWIEKRSAGQK